MTPVHGPATLEFTGGSMLGSTTTMTLSTFVERGLPFGERYLMLAVAVCVLIWVLSASAGVVLLFASLAQANGWMLGIRRFLAMVNVIATGVAALIFVIIGELHSAPILFTALGIIMACILGIPVIGHNARSMNESTSDSPEVQGKRPP